MECNGLLDWLRDASGARGFHFAETRGGWAFRSYQEIAARSWGLAEDLVELLPAGKSAACLLPSSVEFPVAVWAALLLGAAPAPIAPPRPGRVADDLGRITSQLAGLHPDVLLTTTGLADVADRAVRQASLEIPVVRVDEIARESAPGIVPSAPDRVLVQFSSGSTSSPKAIEIDRENLESNLRDIIQWLGADRWSSGASWLPLHHDMGLIGCMFMPSVVGSDVYSFTPEQFIRSPSRWLRCFGEGRARITAAPTFGYSYAVRRVGRQAASELAGLDFSEWRIAIVGAERVSATVLHSFTSMLAPFGFRSSTFCPAYGMAEATVAVTGLHLGVAPRLYSSDGASVRYVGTLDEVRPEDMSELLVGSGMSLPSMLVSVRDDADEEQVGHIGSIVVSGPSLSRSVFAAEPETSDAPTCYRTGDVGAVVGDELVVLGRAGDSIKVRGAKVFLAAVEDALRYRGLVSDLNAALLTGVEQGRQCVVLTTDRELARPDDVLALLEETLGGPDITISIETVPRGDLLFTPSGKPRRQEMWRRLMNTRGPQTAS